VFLPVLLVLFGPGCGPRPILRRVAPYQREYLTERCMKPGFGDKAELKFRQHWEGARQGFDDGFGEAGGGCGCN
jgi:hypothetical protein